MIAVVFEAGMPGAGHTDYLDFAAELRPLLAEIDGLFPIERFQTLSRPEEALSVSFWRDEAALAAWRKLPDHRRVQTTGRDHVFADYRLCVAQVARDCGKTDRGQRPPDSRAAHSWDR